MQTPSDATPLLSGRALGMNDMQSALKRDTGLSRFAVNFQCSRDVWTRREGRSFYFYQAGMVMSLATLAWEDGLTNDIAQIGGNLWNLAADYTYLFSSTIRLIIQAPDGVYWNCTPDETTGIISPTAVATPSATPQTANITVAATEILAFTATGCVVELNCSQDVGGWYLESRYPGTGVTTVSTDWVFTYASGIRLRKVDTAGNTWEFKVDNDGKLYVETV